MSPHLLIAASFEDSNGYGVFTNNIIRHLIEQGIKVRLSAMFNHMPPTDLMPYVNFGPPPKIHDIVFTSISNNPPEVKGNVIFTMSETLEVLENFGRPLRRYKHIIVPSAFSAAAVKPWNRNIHICPLGVDMPWSPIVYDPFVFTAVATDHMCPERKRIQELTDTFSRIFPREANVRLQLKRSSYCSPIYSFDSRVNVVAAHLGRQAYNDMMKTTTVGIQPSCMEGWSLPVTEFMAMGRPTIASKVGAIGDQLPADSCFEVNYGKRRAPVPVFGGKGTIYYSDMKHMAKQMRFAYENGLEVARRGLRAYEAAQQFTKYKMGQRFLEICQTILT